MPEPIRRSLKFPDREVSVLEWQADAPLLHFAHANGFNAETYRALLTPLQGRFRVAASDLRGHGFTTLPAVPGMQTGWRIFGVDLARIVDALEPSRPVILAGHSMGAIASLMVAAARPERVAGLMLVEPVLVPPLARLTVRLLSLVGRGVPPNYDLAALADKRRAIFPAYDMALSAYRGRGAFKTWPPEMLRDYLNGGLVETGNGTERALACAPAWEAASYRNAPQGIALLARRVRCPITLIHAERGTARPSQVALIGWLTRKARIVKVPGTTHFLPMERPDIVRDEIERMGRVAMESPSPPSGGEGV